MDGKACVGDIFTMHTCQATKTSRVRAGPLVIYEGDDVGFMAGAQNMLVVIPYCPWCGKLLAKQVAAEVPF